MSTETLPEQDQANIARILAEANKLQSEAIKLQAEAGNLQAETSKRQAETSQISQHIRWYVIVLIATGVAGTMTLGLLIGRFVLLELPS